jgi:hypothetical protein
VPESAKEPIRLQSAADLFSVLSSGPPTAQFAVLRSIVDDPTRPIALGSHEGEDIVDLLLRLIPLASGGLKQLQILCLSCYEDPRTTRFMIEEFAQSRDPATVLHLGRRLSMESDPEFFVPFLWQDEPAQALAAARLLSESDTLSSRDRLRVAIWIDQPFEPPAIGPATLDLWLDELRGRHRKRVRRLAEQRGDEVLGLWERMSELADEEIAWLLGRTVLHDPVLAKEQLGSLLEVADIPFPIVEQALALGVALPPGLLRSKHERVRAAAVGAGLAGESVETYLGASTGEAAAAARWCPTSRLVGLLADPRWQVRAAATAALVERDDPPIDDLRRKVASPLLGERVAAIEVLRRLGDDEWLEGALLTR